MAVLSLFTGLGNYLKTIERYRVKRALVQSGYKTQIVSSKCIHASIKQQMYTYITVIDYLDSVVDYYSDLCFLHCTTTPKVFLNWPLWYGHAIGKREFPDRLVLML